MAFVNYKTANNVYTYLSMALSADATVMNVNDGDIFPTEYPFIVTLEHYDDDGNCVKREIVLCTNRENNAITIERAFESSVADDTENPKQLKQTPFNFIAGDSVSLTLTSALITDIQDEIARQLDNLETAQSCIDTDNQRLADIEDFINNL